MWNFPCETIESASADRRKYPFNFLNLLFIMKCSVFVVAVALVMASCSQDETTGINKGSTIRFRTSVERTTRGVQTTLADLGEFKVTAVGNGANYFTDLGVSSSDNGATWTPAKIYYWPSYDLDFCAYAPQSLAGVSVSADARTIEDFIPSATVADQQDLLIACNTGSKFRGFAEFQACLVANQCEGQMHESRHAGRGARREDMSGPIDGDFYFPVGGHL